MDAMTQFTTANLSNAPFRKALIKLGQFPI
jgi:hypothetical protein